jgi:putative nucleotidyltransferase with HDIG domain
MNAVSFELPALPAPRMRALALLNDDNSGLRDVSEVVEGDPALTAAVLRAANSAISAPRSRIRSASQSIVRIGLGATRRIVMGAVVGNAFEQLERADLDVDGLWRHLIATALIADTAGKVGQGTTDAFTSGLLHDIGRLAMASRDPNRYARIVSLARRGVPVVEAEHLMYGATHLQVGVELAREWRIPLEIIEAIGSHHDDETLTALSAAVAQGRRTAGHLGIGDGVLTAQPDLPAAGSPEDRILREMRGAKALMSRIEWYREAIQEF